MLALAGYSSFQTCLGVRSAHCIVGNVLHTRSAAVSFACSDSLLHHPLQTARQQGLQRRCKWFGGLADAGSIVCTPDWVLDLSQALCSLLITGRGTPEPHQGRRLSCGVYHWQNCYLHSLKAACTLQIRGWPPSYRSFHSTGCPRWQLLLILLLFQYIYIYIFLLAALS